MEKEPKPELPYEENDESFGEWFRRDAKEKWESYLNGEKGITLKERDAMREFLVRHGTEEEIQRKLCSYGSNLLAAEALRKEIKLKRPDAKFDY
jgi:hypothetical protein